MIRELNLTKTTSAIMSQTSKSHMVCILLTMLVLFSSASAFAVPIIYSATIPCGGKPILNPPGDINLVAGNTDTLMFEVIPQTPDVHVSVKSWKFNNNTVTNTSILHWGDFNTAGDRKSLTWTLGADAKGEFTLSVTLVRSCGGVGEGGGKEKTLTITWGGAVSPLNIHFTGTPYACAGHIAGDPAAHTFDETAHITNDNGDDVADQNFVLYFDGNTGHPDKASFKVLSNDANDNHTEQVHLTTGPHGTASFSVLSSDTVTNSIKIKAKYQTESGAQKKFGNKNNSITCHFGAPVSKLPTGKGLYPEDKNHGWWFEPQYLLSDGDTTTLTAKIYLRYKEPSGYYVPVTGHTLRIILDSQHVTVTARGNFSTSGHNTSDYLSIVNDEGKKLTQEDVITHSIRETLTTDKDDGFADVTLEGGDFSWQAKSIKFLHVKDMSVYEKTQQ